MNRRSILPVVVVASCFACKKQEQPSPTPAPSTSAAPSTAPAAFGTVTGHVRFKGKLEPHEKIEHPSDPYCEKIGVEKPEITRIGAGDGLLDVVVHLENGSVKGDPSLAPKAVIRQKGCAYAPYAVGVLVGAEVEFVNDDRTMHNIHGLFGEADVINFALASGQPPRTVQAPKDPGIVRLRCDVHNWMRGYLVVSDHPFFTNTGDDGTFTLPKVPAGSRVIEAYHPLHGIKKLTVDVKPNETVAADFAFTDADKGT